MTQCKSIKHTDLFIVARFSHCRKQCSDLNSRADFYLDTEGKDFKWFRLATLNSTILGDIQNKPSDYISLCLVTKNKVILINKSQINCYTIYCNSSHWEVTRWGKFSVTTKDKLLPVQNVLSHLFCWAFFL